MSKFTLEEWMGTKPDIFHIDDKVNDLIEAKAKEFMSLCIAHDVPMVMGLSLSQSVNSTQVSYSCSMQRVDRVPSCFLAAHALLSMGLTQEAIETIEAVGLAEYSRENPAVSLKLVGDNDVH